MTAETMTPVAIALGSNLGDRAAAIRSACAAFGDHPRCRALRVSQFHETEPVGPPGQGRYLNAALRFDTDLAPRDLLAFCLDVEARHGRTRDASERWGPRTLDLDILLVGMAVIDEPGLTIPHPRLHERAFVLQPLAEVADDLMHPVLRRSVRELLTDLTASAPSP